MYANVEWDKERERGRKSERQVVASCTCIALNDARQKYATKTENKKAAAVFLLLLLLLQLATQL